MSLVNILREASTSACGAMRSPMTLGLLVSSALSLVDTTSAKTSPASWSGILLPLVQTSSGLRVSNARSTSSAILELRRLSGLTWEQLARLFGVDRRSLHFWANGKPLTPAHEERLQRLLATVRRFDRGRARENRALLLEARADGLIPFDLLVEGKFEQALALIAPAVHPTAMQRAAPLSTEARTVRAPPPPSELVGALQDRVHTDKGRLLSVTPIRTKRGS
jgi:transcriptional regulator with XRE-family HTH domain